MDVEIAEHGATELDEYARVPIAFVVRSVVDAQPSPTSANLILEERPLSTPFVKDYDALSNNGPVDWPKRFDVASWRFFAARLNGVRVGGAAIAFRCSGIDMLEARDDLALLWDIRVMPEARGKGVGSALLAAVETWARERNARWLEVETQNINVPACRFYERHGFALKAANALAYPGLPDEVQFLWGKAIGA
jgi:GNAT superfamily N-acetyltransferase